MIDEKYTKKTNTYILKEVLKINPKVSPKTTYDQAFVILMDVFFCHCVDSTTIC